MDNDTTLIGVAIFYFVVFFYLLYVRCSFDFESWWNWYHGNPYRTAAMIAFIVIPPIVKWIQWIHGFHLWIDGGE